jgi:lipopolysaccharide/colanic/teichoic acid biosynthesis glycosyltransferase
MNKMFAKRPTLPFSPLPIADKSSFERLLSLERRRSERTGEPFALMLVSFEGLTGRVGPEELDPIAQLISSAMRETDLKGWPERPSTFGVILTTLNGTTRGSFESIMARRVRESLASILRPDQVQMIQISFRYFPEGTGEGNPWKPDRIFYRESETASAGKGASLKKAIDISGSLAAMVLLSPLFLVIPILIKATSAGPVFFRQKRIGLSGKEFTFLKFRSMHVNCDPSIHREYVQNLIDSKIDEADGTYKIKNDPRVTPIGRLLRKSSLDELPQFINVLRGDMSLVGPRPPIPYEFESYSVWHRRRLLDTKPGITGEWQVNGRSRTTFDEMVRMDLLYIRNRSLWRDLGILLKTPYAVISGDGAY